MTGFDSKRRRSPRRTPAGQTRVRRGIGAAIRPSGVDHISNGLSFADVLHECLAAGVAVIDVKKKVVSANAHARQLLGLSSDPAVLPSFATLPAGVRAVVREAMKPDAPPADRQVDLRGDSRRSATLRVTAIPLHGGRKSNGVVLVLNDLTPAHQIEQHVLQLDRLASIGTLAASMAHEIKNALVAGKTFVDLLLEKHQDAELVDVVRREMGRIDALVSRMRKFAGPTRPMLREVRLHEILEHSLQLVQPQLEEKLISVTRSFQAVPDVLHGDDYQLQQAFVNLLLNALEALGPNGTLSVSTSILPLVPASADSAGGPAHPRLQLTIADNGIGISPENLPRLFEPFFTTKPNGTGLGLLITRRIIQEHHGDITVHSQPDKGTSFQILLPASA